MTADPMPPPPAADGDGQVTIVLDRKTVSVARKANETLLDSARRAGLSPPFSCEAGNCGTCMGKLLEGRATMRVNDALDEDEVLMRVNDALDEDEVEEGYVLTCQAVPDTDTISVTYDD